MSLTNTDPIKIKYFPKFKWPRIINPSMKFPLNEENLNEVVSLEKLAIDNIKTSIKENKHEIAAIIIEPIQGEGGDNHFRDEFFVELKSICDDNDILFIMDEVQTGIGITGKMWCHEHNTVNPDIICFGKKTQVCGILAGKKLDQIDNHVFKKSSRINSTFGGSLVDMIRFKIILEVIEKENLLKKAKINGIYLQSKLQMLSEEFPGFVTNNRGKGLFCAFDLPSTSERNDAWKMMMEQGLLILTSGNESIRFRPHLTVTKNEIDTAIDMIEKSIRLILK